MTDRMNGVAAHQKDKSSAENDAAESAACPAPAGAESAGAGVPAPEAAASAPTDPPELASAATLQQCAPDLSHSSAHRLCLIHRAAPRALRLTAWASGACPAASALALH
eukprot:scaffold38025_cov69-Phaeocystis_antarctica.AAC.4